jgi:nitrate/nitrite-specific signal transduction histidine kinase
VPSGGFGLVGMRERAELTGAHLEVGPSPDGGWLVALRLPVSEPPTEPTTGPTTDPTPEESR